MTVYEGNPGYIELTNVVYSPKQKFLVYPDGSPVFESCRLRGAKQLKYVDYELAANITAEYERVYERPVVYLGYLPYHFGHLLTEGLARTWFFYRYPEICESCELIFHGTESNPFLRFLSKNEPSLKRLKAPRTSVLLSKVYLPLASLAINYYAYQDYSLLFRRITKNIISSAPHDNPLYLSRTQLPQDRRQVAGEEEVERFAGKRGCTVFYPEKHSLDKQIQMINQHNTVIGFKGSAFHINVFRKHADNFYQHCFSVGSGRGTTYDLINRVMNFAGKARAHKTCQIDLNCKKERSKQNWVCDIDATKKIIKGIV